MPGGQQQLALDPLQGTAPDTAVMVRSSYDPVLATRSQQLATGFCTIGHFNGLHCYFFIKNYSSFHL